MNKTTSNLTELEEIFDRLYQPIFDDFIRYCKEWLRIKDEDGNILPFELNELQLYVFREMMKQKAELGYIRLNILKCRQTGISTVIEAYIHWENHKDFNLKTIIIGHESEASGNLYDMYFRYHENLPEEVKPIIDKNQHQKKISYLKLKNEIVVKTAKAGVDYTKAGSGRSGTFNYIHATEAAFYPDYKTTFLGLLQASKKARLIVVETTANGFNEYRSDYFDAKNGRSDYKAIFLSWLDFKTYTKPFRSDAEKEKLQRTLGVDPRYNEYKGEEQLLIEFHNATLEQLNWRRWAIDNLCKGEVMHFHQEYPKDDIEAFLSTGTPVFNVQICKTNLEEATKQKESGNYKIGELIPVYDFTSAEYRRLVALGKTDYQSLSPFIKEIKFQENVKGFIRLHYETKLRDDERYRFVGGSDVAEGLAQGDFTVCKVMDRKTNQVILTWHGHLNTDLYAEELHKIQVYFNNQIYFAVERNNHGLAVINYAHRLGVNLYYAETFEKGFTENTELLGFKTHAGTRTQMINDLKAAIRDGEFADSEPEFWEETLTFVFNEHGKMQAQGKDKDPSIKSYDDRIFAAIGMWKCHLWMPNFKKVKVEDTNVEALLKRIKEKNRKLTAGTTAMSR